MRPGIDAGLRSHHGRTRWVRPGRPLFDPKQHEVARCPDRLARLLVESHHYSHSWPSALRCYALYKGPFAVGAVVISYPMNDLVLTGPYPDLVPGDESAEIGRVILLPGAPFNAASWTVRRVLEMERNRGTLGLVAFSDPVKRTTLAGEVVLPGHTGITYQALGAIKSGRSTARTRLLLPNATEIPERGLQKVRKQERGWKAVVRRCVKAGLPDPGEDTAGWARKVSGLVRKLPHKGNHRYLFLLDPIVGLTRPPELYPTDIDDFQEVLL